MAVPVVNVAYLGPAGTYSHQAAVEKFGKDAKFIEQETITDVFNALSMTVRFGVVPQENSIFGTVVETYNYLRRPDVGSSKWVVGEMTMGVKHCLLARQGVRLHEITEVLSHEQALGQCRKFLSRNLAHATEIKTTSTAAAAEALLSPRHAKAAAICSKLCVSIFPGLSVLHEGIQDADDNHTRFYVIGSTQRRELTPSPSSCANFQRKALIRLHPNSSCIIRLLDCNLQPFLTALDLPVTRIDRRPSLCPYPFHDIYFIEVQDDAECSVPEVQKHEAWLQRVHQVIQQYMELGGQAYLLGIW